MKKENNFGTKIIIVAFVFALFGFMVGLIIMNSAITGHPIFNTSWTIPSQTVVIDDNPLINNTNQTNSDFPNEEMLAMMDIVQGTSRFIDFSRMTSLDWVNLKDYAEFSSIVTKTWTKENVNKLGQEGTLNLFNQNLKSSKNTLLASKTYKLISQEELNERLSKSSSGSGIGENQIDLTVGECHCGLQCCCAWGFWGLAQSCEGWLNQ